MNIRACAIWNGWGGRRSSRARNPQWAGLNRSGFTLLEVMIASGIFFLAIFAILSLVSANIRNARLLQKPQVDAGLLLSDLIQTNKLTEGSDSGDFGDLYKGYRWNSEITQVATNGFFKVEYTITTPEGGPNSESRISVLLYRPESTPGAGF